MTIELLFYTQIAAILGYITAAFILYRLLISQKDSVIELLKERNELLQERISDLERQSPDVLVNALAKRVDIAKKEIEALSKDGAIHAEEIARKEKSLAILKRKVETLDQLLKETDMVCPHCQAPLTRREWHTIYGEVDGREAEANIEYIEYACGFSTTDDGRGPISECGCSG